MPLKRDMLVRRRVGTLVVCEPSLNLSEGNARIFFTMNMPHMPWTSVQPPDGNLATNPTWTAHTKKVAEFTT